MNGLKAGFARVNATPMMGIGMRGYFEKRYAEGVLDELEITALALGCGDERALLISMDICAIPRECALAFKAHIAETVSIPAENIYIHATHTHTGPFLYKDSEDALESAKRELLEETGYESDEWTHLLTVPSNATIADNYAHLFAARNCRKVAGQDLDDTEYLNVVKHSAAEIEELIAGGGFQQAMHITAWLLAGRNGGV